MKYKLINKYNLKLIAVITMIIDHIGCYLLNNFFLFRLIGRISFPIYAFCIADGIKHTQNKYKYLLRITYLAFISEIIFDLNYAGILTLERQNILFTFTLFILNILLFENIKNIKDNTFKIFFYFIIITMSFIITSFFNFDYSIYGLLLLYIFYFIKKENFMLLLAAILIILFNRSWSNFAIFSLIFIKLYNNKKGKNNNILFYYIYPIHLLIIYIIKLIC